MEWCITSINIFLNNFRNGHMLTHRNKKPYECKAEGCGKSYCDARSLRRHTENHHSSLAMTPTTPNQSLSSSTGPPTGLSLSPATASGKDLLYLFCICCCFFFTVFGSIINNMENDYDYAYDYDYDNTIYAFRYLLLFMIHIIARFTFAVFIHIYI